MYVCMYVCMYVYTYVCVFVHPPMIYPNDPQWRFYLIFAHGPPLSTMQDPFGALCS